jgi:hypothetical protein
VTDEVSQFDLAAMGFFYLRFITPLSMTAASLNRLLFTSSAVAYLNYFFVPPFFGDACAGKQRTRVLRDRGRKGMGDTVIDNALDSSRQSLMRSASSRNLS